MLARQRLDKVWQNIAALNLSNKIGGQVLSTKLIITQMLDTEKSSLIDFIYEKHLNK